MELRKSIIMDSTDSSYHHWRPSDPSRACVGIMDSPYFGSHRQGKEYEEFLCLYPFLKPIYTEFEMNWRPFWILNYMQTNTWIPFLSLILYAVMIVGGTKYFENRKAWNLKTPLMLWNLGLALFSFIGFIRVFPVVAHITLNYTWEENICFEPMAHSGNNEAGVWIMFFSLSKIAELFDTFFLSLFIRSRLSSCIGIIT